MVGLVSPQQRCVGSEGLSAWVTLGQSLESQTQLHPVPGPHSRCTGGLGVTTIVHVESGHGSGCRGDCRWWTLLVGDNICSLIFSENSRHEGFSQLCQVPKPISRALDASAALDRPWAHVGPTSLS